MGPHLDARYGDIMHRRSAADGRFWYGVTTTHVLCRPSCSGRLPLPDHVEYFDTPDAGLRAGFRPCKRCRPLGVESAVVLREAVVTTPLGDMVAVGTGHGLTLLEFADRPMLGTQRARVRALFGSEILPGDFPALPMVQEALDGYFAGSTRPFLVPLLPLGTPFQRTVWRALMDVPAGTTISYDALAARAGRPGAARAAGRANGDNRLSILVPCHRVIGADGTLTGYGGGLWRKEALLALEARQAKRAPALR